MDLGIKGRKAIICASSQGLGLACATANVNCGVFWNTLMLATASATAATALGLSFALIATRTGFRAKKALRMLTVLPIITPPFVIGLGLILIFGRSGVVNQAADAVFGVQLGRWIYGFGGVWLAQVFSFTPTAFLVLIGVVEAISPSMEEASTSGSALVRSFSGEPYSSRQFTGARSSFCSQVEASLKEARACPSSAAGWSGRISSARP